MGEQIQLVPLICPRCSTRVPASVDEVAWVCGQCGQGMYLDDEHGLRTQEVNFSSAIPAHNIGKPFWVVDGKVEIQRVTFGSSGSSKESAQFWSEPHRFFVPAYQASLDELLATSIELLRKNPPLQQGAPAKFKPVTLYIQDIQSAVEFIVVAVEANRSDKLKEIHFDLHLSQPALWILP